MSTCLVPLSESSISTSSGIHIWFTRNRIAPCPFMPLFSPCKNLIRGNGIESMRWVRITAAMKERFDLPPDLQPSLDILIVENDPASAYLTKEAFREAGKTEGIQLLPDGDEALALLRREGKYAKDPYPDIVFLDLHLPKKSGLDVLAELKSNSRLASVPVVVVSGSDNPDEIRRAYELHASCYIRKPNDLVGFLRFIQISFDFWGSVVAFPPKPQLASTH